MIPRRCRADEQKRRLVAAEIPAGRVATIEVVSHPHTLAREMAVEIQTTGDQQLRVLGNPLKMSGTPVRLDRPASRRARSTNPS
ncbi:CoA transferase [Rhizobium ruizarguesonis]|uniref:CoA transferase n=1 Tax=Rhizobium ruizarguesonis TaxID=2081791 RepID=UPI001FE0C57E|nr:CoA transferase [Rhizobium ruizarguesonis]